MAMKTVDAKTLKSWMASGEAVVIDVREPAEHAAEKIDGTTLVPLGSFCKSALPEVSGRKLVIHCRSGKRSANACEKLLAENPDMEVYNLDGGIMAWSELGNSVESSGSFFLPLDRQVQLTIGAMLLLGSVLGYFLGTLFFILTGLIGIGLMIAGLTGFCGLATFIARMPWNQKIGKTTSCSVAK